MRTLLPSGLCVINLPIGYVESALKSISDSILNFMPKLNLVTRTVPVLPGYPIFKLDLALRRSRRFVDECESALTGFQTLGTGRQPGDEHKCTSGGFLNHFLGQQ